MSDILQHAEVQSGLADLAATGLNLAAVLPIDELPAAVQAILDDEKVVTAEHQRLVLLGHGGRRFWEALEAEGGLQSHTENPVDRFSESLVRRFVQRTLKDPGWRLIYPGTTRLPLQTLGELVGWAHSSPLGLGIHPEYGLWWAYRAAFLTTKTLPRLVAGPFDHPCRRCADQPCVGTCPAGALSTTASIDLIRCSRRRLAEDSGCSDRCLAREACPVGADHRYSRAQIGYHYRQSLTTLQRYFAHG